MNFGVYTNRNMIGYFGLSIPALVLQVIFILSLLRIPIISLPGVFHYADLAIQIAPWLVLVVSVFAVVRFRTSLLLTLLVVSYFISAIVSGSASLNAAGYILSQAEIAGFVVAASFCSLIGFNFLRAAKIEKKRAIVSSKGPLPHQIISVFLELFLPALVAVGLILITIQVVRAFETETALFPQPLSSVFSNFILSPIVTIITAALIIALVKDLVEPWILYYTLNRDDAINIMQKEATQMETVRGFTGRLASGSMLFSLVVVVILLAIIVLFFGTGSLMANMGPVFRMGTPSSQASYMIRIDNGFIQIENVLNTIIHLLWG